MIAESEMAPEPQDLVSMTWHQPSALACVPKFFLWLFPEQSILSRTCGPFLAQAYMAVRGLAMGLFFIQSLSSYNLTPSSGKCPPNLIPSLPALPGDQAKTKPFVPTPTLNSLTSFADSTSQIHLLFFHPQSVQGTRLFT